MGLYFDSPTPPNPQATAASQTNSNVNTAVANSVIGNANVYTPTGSSTFKQIGSQTIPDGNGGTINVPQYENDQTLSPEQQKLYNQQTQLGSSMNNLAQSQVDRLSNVMNKPLDLNGLPAGVNSVNTPNLQTSFDAGGPIQKNVSLNDASTRLGLNSNAPTEFGQTAGNIRYNYGPTDFSQDRTKVEDAIYSRLQPQQDRDMAALQTRLANQGVVQGSQAWNTAMDSINRSNTDARMQAVLAGGQEQSRLAGLAQNQAQFNNTAQGQDFSQQQARGLFGQAGIAQNNQALTTEGQFHNAGIAQNNDAALASGNFANSAQDQQYGQNRDLANFGNSANQQNFSNNVTAGNFANTSRTRSLQETLAERNQPLNEISALMSGGQVTMPQFAAYQGGNVDSTPIGSYINQNYQTQAQQAASNNAALAGVFGSIGGAATRGLFGGYKPGTGA